MSTIEPLETVFGGSTFQAGGQLGYVNRYIAPIEEGGIGFDPLLNEVMTVRTPENRRPAVLADIVKHFKQGYSRIPAVEKVKGLTLSDNPVFTDRNQAEGAVKARYDWIVDIYGSNLGQWRTGHGHLNNEGGVPMFRNVDLTLEPQGIYIRRLDDSEFRMVYKPDEVSDPIPPWEGPVLNPDCDGGGGGGGSERPEYGLLYPRKV